VVRGLESGDAHALTRLVEEGAGWSRTESDLFTQFAARLVEHHRKSRAATHASLLHEVEWRPRARAKGPSKPAAPGTWLLLADRGGVAEGVARELERRGAAAIVARPGPALALEGRAWSFDPTNPEQCGALVAALERGEGKSRVRGIVHLLGLDFRPTAATTVATLEEDHERGLMSLLYLAQALPENDPASPQLWVVTRGAAPADAARHGINVSASALWGLGRAYSLERPDQWGGLLDLDPAGLPAGPDIGSGPLVDELLEPDGEDQIAWRGHQRFVPRLVVATGVALAPVAVAPDRTYLVAGGFGQAGRRMVRTLLERGARHFVLVGRGGDATPQAKELLQTLREAGAEARVVAADVSDPEAMRRVAAALSDGPPLGGVVHAAGVARFDRIAATRPEDFRAVLAAKVRGTWLLHELTRERPVDLFVGFSSIASVWGSAGQLHLSAANRFQDAIAFARRHLGLAATSVSFSPWKGGSAPNEEFNRFMASLGVAPIDPAEGLPELEAAIASSRAHVVLAKVEWGLFRSVMEARRRRPLFEELAVASTARQADTRPTAGDLRGELAAAPPAERAELLGAHLQDQLGELMGFGAERPDPQRGFIELGVDSLMAVTLRDRLQTSLGVELPVTFIFDHPTIEALAEHLLANVLVLAKGPAAAAPESPAAPASRDSLMNEARELSPDQLERAIAQQLKELGLH
jgi:NAD(P)-dependent dehydrogenase (short-subunit alcohol dehydrogenase family)/acyl carrier protein